MRWRAATAAVRQVTAAMFEAPSLKRRNCATTLYAACEAGTRGRAQRPYTRHERPEPGNVRNDPIRGVVPGGRTQGQAQRPFTRHEGAKLGTCATTLYTARRAELRDMRNDPIRGTRGSNSGRAQRPYTWRDGPNSGKCATTLYAARAGQAREVRNDPIRGRRVQGRSGGAPAMREGRGSGTTLTLVASRLDLSRAAGEVHAPTTVPVAVTAGRLPSRADLRVGSHRGPA